MLCLAHKILDTLGNTDGFVHTTVLGLDVNVSRGIATFSSDLDEVTLEQKINAAFDALGNHNGATLAFESNDKTYVAFNLNDDTGYQAGTDLVILLTGVTGATGLEAIDTETAADTLVLSWAAA